MLDSDDMKLFFKFGSITSFLASILYFTVFTVGGDSTLTTVLSSLAIVILCFGSACFIVSMPLFITDQIIGATSNELSAVVRWYYWAQYVGICLSYTSIYCFRISNLEIVYVGSTLIYAVPLAVVIISDCFCQQWLDRTNKVTNPIKLIIQVLNYTRKHRYPERRSAFTFIDEEQPTRMDYGKEKFGGPFTEEEVEDVKTVLRLLPLVICLSLSVGSLSIVRNAHLFEGMELLNETFSNFLYPVLLIPLYQLLLYRCFHSCIPSMLRCLGAGLFMCTLGHILLTASGVYGVILSDHIQIYLSCIGSLPNTTNQVDLYLTLGSWTLYGIGSAIAAVLFLEFIIAQSPDKMKGFVMGIVVFFHGIVSYFCSLFFSVHFVLRLDIIIVLFVVFLVLSKRYTLRERNREINIQAIVEEHYERYMDQEEEYMRQQHY